MKLLVSEFNPSSCIHVTTHVNSFTLVASSVSLEIGVLLGSQSESHFNFARQMLISLINKLKIGEQDTRVGVVVYGKDASLRILLGQYNLRGVLNKAIERLPYPGSGLRLDKALEYIETLFRNGYVDVPKTLIIFTDRRPDDASLLLAAKAAGKGISIVTIIMGEAARNPGTSPGGGLVVLITNPEDSGSNNVIDILVDGVYPG